MGVGRTSGHLPCISVRVKVMPAAAAESNARDPRASYYILFPTASIEKRRSDSTFRRWASKNIARPSQETDETTVRQRDHETDHIIQTRHQQSNMANCKPPCQEAIMKPTTPTNNGKTMWKTRSPIKSECLERGGVRMSALAGTNCQVHPPADSKPPW
jgi:hypothetical protein